MIQTAGEFAAEVGASEPTIWRWESLGWETDNTAIRPKYRRKMAELERRFEQ